MTRKEAEEEQKEYLKAIATFMRTAKCFDATMLCLAVASVKLKTES